MSRARRRSALRLAARAALSALIGAAATVFTAWASAASGVPLKMASGSEAQAPWPEPLPAAWPHRGSAVRFRLAHPFVTRELYLGPKHSGSASTVIAGWPARSMAGGSWSWKAIGHTARETYYLAEPPDAQKAGTPRSIPLRPLWPGFLVDTAFYAGLAFVVWGAPGLVRRRVRRRRGRCAACGYELGSFAVCPECGP